MAIKMVIVAIVMVCIVMASPIAEAKISCGFVYGEITPCLSYLRGKGPTVPPPTCCSGVKALNNAATTTQDRQAACACLKSAVINLGLATGLPGKCGVSIPYKISPSTDCSKVT